MNIWKNEWRSPPDKKKKKCQTKKKHCQIDSAPLWKSKCTDTMANHFGILFTIIFAAPVVVRPQFSGSHGPWLVMIYLSNVWFSNAILLIYQMVVWYPLKWKNKGERTVILVRYSRDIHRILRRYQFMGYFSEIWFWDALGELCRDCGRLYCRNDGVYIPYIHRYFLKIHNILEI